MQIRSYTARSLQLPCAKALFDDKLQVASAQTKVFTLFFKFSFDIHLLLIDTGESPVTVRASTIGHFSAIIKTFRKFEDATKPVIFCILFALPRKHYYESFKIFSLSYSGFCLTTGWFEYLGHSIGSSFEVHLRIVHVQCRTIPFWKLIHIWKEGFISPRFLYGLEFLTDFSSYFLSPWKNISYQLFFSPFKELFLSFSSSVGLLD